MSTKLFLYDGVKWTTNLEPLCVKHNMELDAGQLTEDGYWREEDFGMDDYCEHLLCAEGPHAIKLTKSLGETRKYIQKRLNAKLYEDAELIDIDGTLIPVNDKVKVKDDNFFVTSQIKQSKKGTQVVIYAGEKGKKSKSERTQLFIDPEQKRMSFDQNGLNPADVFAKIEATFRDGTKHTIEKKITENLEKLQ